jgi:hypothetical protein
MSQSHDQEPYFGWTELWLDIALGALSAFAVLGMVYAIWSWFV